MDNDLFEGKAFARNTDPDTSHAAAREMEESGSVSRTERKALDAFLSHPAGLSNDQLVAVTGVDWNTITNRVAPLRRKSLVSALLDDKGDVVKTRGKRGKLQQVNVATTFARELRKAGKI